MACRIRCGHWINYPVHGVDGQIVDARQQKAAPINLPAWEIYCRFQFSCRHENCDSVSHLMQATRRGDKMAKSRDGTLKEPHAGVRFRYCTEICGWETQEKLVRRSDEFARISRRGRDL